MQLRFENTHVQEYEHRQSQELELTTLHCASVPKDGASLIVSAPSWTWLYNLLLHWLWCQIERTLFADVHHQCRHQDSSRTNWCLDNGWCARSLVAQICPSAQPGARSFSVRGRRRQFSHRSRCYSVRPQPATINRLLDAQSFTDKKRKTIKTI